MAGLCLLPSIALAASSIRNRVEYTTAASILALTPEQAMRGTPVVLRGVVTLSADIGLNIQDRTAGIWIVTDHPAGFSPGDILEVKGIVDPGRFSPVVRADSVRVLGHAHLPEAKEVTFRQLSSGDEDTQYVSITGTVRSMRIRLGISQTQTTWLKIAMPGGFVDVTFPATYAAAGSKLIDAVVRIQAVAMCTKNQTGQITSATLAAVSMRYLTVLSSPPRDLFASPLTPIGKLMQYRSGTDYFHRVRVAGTVTYYKPDESLILENDDRALLVMTTQRSDIQIGDRIEVSGFPAPTDSGPILEDAVFRYVAHGSPPQPAIVKISDISSGALRYNLVSAEGHLVRRVEEPSRAVLLLQDGPSLLLAELEKPDGSNPLRGLEEGSTIRISGISMLDVQGTWNYGSPSASVVRCKLMLRSADDVQLIRSPSWWTTLHVLYIVAILAILLLASFALAAYTRAEHWKLQAVLEERERLAHEIHDTLAQSFAGIGFQLQAIRKGIPESMQHLQQQVELARDLVRHSHKEARRSIEPLQLEPKEIQLLPSLEACARKMVRGGALEISTISTGVHRTLPPYIADALLGIGQEAIANAIRHADPKHLVIHLAYEDYTVRLRVTDDGCGFVKSGDLLGFGLRSMRRRAAGIQARLAILSQPGEGTRVEVDAPLPPGFGLTSYFKRIWKYLFERKTHVESERQTHPDPNC
jgi:signal transduction histidine kinase